MNENEKAAGLPRRQFVRLSGVAGAAALLTGTEAGKNPATPARFPGCGCGNQPSGPDYCPPPIDYKMCGNPMDTGPRLELWEEVQVCEAKKPACTSLLTTPNYVILHGDPKTNHNFLLVPSCRITGIECSFIWGPKAYPGYWNDAWEQAQPGGAAPVDYKNIGLGINSAIPGIRMQDQLHIHMAGIHSKVQDQLYNLEGMHKITTKRDEWKDQVVPVEGYDSKGAAVTRNYRALIISDSELKMNLFMLLGNNVPMAKEHMKDQILFVTPRSNSSFYVLNSDPVTIKDGTGTVDFLLVYK